MANVWPCAIAVDDSTCTVDTSKITASCWNVILQYQASHLRLGKKG